MKKSFENLMKKLNKLQEDNIIIPKKDKSESEANDSKNGSATQDEMYSNL